MNSKIRLGTALGLLAAANLWGIAPLLGASVTTPVDGSMSITQDTCLQGLTNAVGDGENCMYDLGPAAGGNTPLGFEVTGPYNQMAYYDSDDTPAAFQTTPNGLARALYAPAVGDGKIAQVITGSVTIDDGGDGFGPGDLISFTLTLNSPGTGSIIRHYSTTVVDKYDSMTQTLAAVAASSATPNDAGGYDYVIGSEGFPTLLTFSQEGACFGAPFGFVECGHSFATPTEEPNFWNGTSLAGIASLESNLGAKTTGSVTNLECIDSKSATGVESNDCHDSQVSLNPWVNGPCAAPAGCTGNESTPGSVRGAAEDVGWDQLLLKVSTDAAGNVIAVAGFNVDEYKVFGPQRCGDNTVGIGNYAEVCNSWTTGYFTLDPAPPPDAIDDGPYFAAVGVGLDIPVMFNDLNFNSDVFVTVTTAPAQGAVVVNGSPGPAADISISYTAGFGATGSDSFVYSVSPKQGDDPGPVADTATVSLVIGAGANPDVANTGRNQAVDIAVGANDAGLNNSVTVTVNSDFNHGGSATVSAGNGGPAGSIVVTYTPVSAQGDPDYDETFTYTIDDGVLAPSTATVTVRVANRVPANLDGNLQLSTAGVDPAGVTGTFKPSPSKLGNLPATLAISADGTRGTAAVSATGDSIVYTVTDDAFLFGTDSFTYTVTDADGESAAGVVRVDILNADPILAHNYIVTAKGRTSRPLNLRIDGLTPTERVEGGLLEIKLGNGSLDAHVLEVTTQGTEGSCALRPEDGVSEIWFTLVYTPMNAGFVGSDTCTIRLTDADEQAVEDVVDITVVEPSPIGGASSLDPWSLLLLAATPWLRRLRRRPGGQLRSGPGATAKISGSAAATLALMAASAGAWGQAAEGPPEPPVEPERNSAAIEEIVVTARKVAENLQEVPLAITAFDSNVIESKGISNLADVATLTPGLSFFNAFGENLPVPVIRGIAPTDIFGQNNAAIFVDGVYIAGREGLNFSQLDVERIEVVKGPQSSLYGRNAFSGAINYVIKPPSDVFEAKTSLKVGNKDKLEGTAMISGPIWGENLRGRIAALYDDWDGSYENSLATENDLGGHRFRSFQGSLLWLPAEDWEVNLSYFKSNDDIDEAANVSLPTNCENRVNDNNAAERLQNFCGEVPDIEDIPGQNGQDAIARVAQATGENRELDRANLQIEWDLQDYGSLSALTGYSKTQQDSVSDFARNLGVNQVFLYCPDAVNTPGIPNTCTTPLTEELESFTAGIYDRELGGETEEWSQELRYTSSQDLAFRYTGGGYWYRTTQQSFPGGIFATRPLPDNGNVALPPFSDPPDSPNLAIGSAIFYDTFTPDGGIDPLHRPTTDNNTEGWAAFGGVDFDITDRLIGRAELRYSQERQEINILRYHRCLTSATTSGVLGNCAFPEQLIGLTGDDKYDLRDPAPVPQYGPNCVFTSLEGPVKPGTPGQCGRNGSARFDSTTGRIGLDFRITDEWLLYGSVAYGEKPGGLQLASGNEVTSSGTTTVVITNTFDPEELTAYEIGLKGTTWDGRIVISSAVFYNDWKKIVLRQLVENNPETGVRLEQPVALNVNAGDAGVLGFEIETNVGFTENLSGRVTLGWADAELDNAQQDTYELFPTFAAEGYGAEGGDVSGNKLLRQPEWLLSASLDYQHTLAGEWEWYAGADANYQSGVYVGNENQGYLPEHTYVNTRFGLKSGEYTLEFWTRNLFDDGNAVAAFRDIYWANTTDQYSVPPGSADHDARPGFDEFVPLRYTVTYPNERTYGLSVSMRFGGAVR